MSDLLDAGNWVARELTLKRWMSWARTMTWALDRSDDASRAEAVGQGLILFRNFGPGWQRQGDELDVLAESLGRYWPTTSATT